MSRVILIAWDGADSRILNPLLERGDLPYLQVLIDRGQKSVLKSTIPTHSWAAWPSFLTGVGPADHGVYGILETVPGTHKAYPVGLGVASVTSSRCLRGRSDLTLEPSAAPRTVREYPPWNRSNVCIDGWNWRKKIPTPDTSMS